MFHWHRRLAWLMAVPLALWMLSGLLHPMMSNWFKPDIANKFIVSKPVSVDSSDVPVNTLFSDLNELHMIKLIQVENKPVIMAITPDQKRHYRDAISGEHVAEEKYVEQLARDYMDDADSTLVSITKIEEFGAGYSYIHRFVPVYRVVLDRDDGLQVVIDPRTGKLAAYDNKFRRVSSKLFSWLHTWSFLGDRGSWLRIGVVAVMSFCGFLIALTGCVNLWTMRKKKSKKIHYWGGAVTTLLFFMFTLSGFFHVVVKFDYDDSDQWVSKQSVETKLLNSSLKEISEKVGGIKGMTLAVVSDRAYLRVVKAGRDGEVLMLDANNLTELESGDETYAKELALEFSQYNEGDVGKTEKIPKFRNDYGFIFRRLPVWRVSFENKEYWSYTVDTQDAHMAMRTKPLGVIEAISFVNLHKFHFFDPLGKSVRDWVLVGSMALMLSTVISGMLLLRKRKKSKA